MFEIKFQLKKNARNTFRPVTLTGERARFSYKGLSAQSGRLVKLTGREHVIFATRERARELLENVSRDDIRYHGNYQYYSVGGAEISAIDAEGLGLVVDGPTPHQVERARTEETRKATVLREHWGGICPLCGEVLLCSSSSRVRCPNTLDDGHGDKRKAFIRDMPTVESRRMQQSGI